MGGLKEKVRLLIEKTIQTEHGLANHLRIIYPTLHDEEPKYAIFQRLTITFLFRKGRVQIYRLAERELKWGGTCPRPQHKGGNQRPGTLGTKI